MNPDHIVSIRLLIKWLYPITNQTHTFVTNNRVDYSPYMACIARVVLSGLVSDDAGYCKSIKLDKKYIASKEFKYHLNLLNCQFNLETLQESLLQ